MRIGQQVWCVYHSTGAGAGTWYFEYAGRLLSEDKETVAVASELDRDARAAGADPIAFLRAADAGPSREWAEAEAESRNAKGLRPEGAK